jgi:hypothetical protein
MWMVNLLACGLSTAMNSTPESINVAMNARLRERRSSLAMTSLALYFLQAARALSITAFAAFDLGKFRDKLPSAAVQILVDGFPLRREAKPGPALPVRADTKISDKFALVRWHSALREPL